MSDRYVYIPRKTVQECYHNIGLPLEDKSGDDGRFILGISYNSSNHADLESNLSMKQHRGRTEGEEPSRISRPSKEIYEEHFRKNMLWKLDEVLALLDDCYGSVSSVKACLEEVQGESGT